MSALADKINRGLRGTEKLAANMTKAFRKSKVERIRTKVIPRAIFGSKKWTWRAPLIMRAGIALVELRAINDYASEISAKQAGERHLRKLFADIQIDP